MLLHKRKPFRISSIVILAILGHNLGDFGPIKYTLPISSQQTNFWVKQEGEKKSITTFFSDETRFLIKKAKKAPQQLFLHYTHYIHNMF